MLISIVIPCYYSEKTIRTEVEAVMEQFAQNDGYECEFILVNDGSKDGTFSEIRALCDKYPNVKGVDLMRNFGQPNAQMAGLNFARGKYILGMDDDMQTHPSQVFKLIHKIEEGYDVVYGVYPDSKNSFFKKLSSRINRFTSRIMLDMPKEIEATNFWMISDRVRDEAVKYDSFNPYIDAIFYQVTHNYGQVEVEHHKRESGESGYTFGKLVNLWLSYFNYSVVPLRISFGIGLAAAGLAVILSILLIINKIMDPTLPIGWSSMMCVTVFLFGAVLMVLGVIGEYLGKAILILNKTPQFIVRESLNIPAEISQTAGGCSMEAESGSAEAEQEDQCKD